MTPYTHNPDGIYSFGLDGDPQRIVTISVNPARTAPGTTRLGREVV